VSDGVSVTERCKEAGSSSKQSEGKELNSDVESGPSSVIGRCVDCACPYDRFSGLIVCTVCRLPVLVCEVCAVEKCYPGEYHCFRHR
jgi:hypothetical protein